MAQAFDNLAHVVFIEDAGYVMRDCGHHLPPASSGQVCENEVRDGPADIGKGVSVEEEERGAPVAGAEKFYGFVER